MSYWDQWDVPEHVKAFGIDSINKDGHIVLACKYCDDGWGGVIYARDASHILDCIINHMLLLHKEMTE